ncbi:MAG: hypothetical protein CALGDGBN_00811 [Pseudomonadales bacterium]|nr:hypothetical protein [Pseudomonadales bacterium]
MRHVLLPIVIVVSLTFAPTPAAAGTGSDCSRWEQQRQQLRQQLRRPHSAAQANRLHQRLRELGSRIAHGCR